MSTPTDPNATPSSPSTAAEPSTRPPFTAGNLAALKGGHRSPRIVGEVAERIADALLASTPMAAAYPEEVAAVASLEALALLLRRDLAERGIYNAKGGLRDHILREYRAAERDAAKARDRLGLAPMSEASIARERATATTLAVGLHEVAERGRAALATEAEAEVERTAPDFAAEVLDGARAVYSAEREAAAIEHARGTGAPMPEQAPTAATATATATDSDPEAAPGLDSRED